MWPFGPPHLNLNLPTPKRKTRKKGKMHGMLSKMPFWAWGKILWNLKIEETLKKGISATLKTPSFGPKWWAHTFGNISPFADFCQSVTFFLAMLCRDGHKIPPNILKPLSLLCFVVSNYVFAFLRPLFHHCSHKAIFRKVADNSQQTQEHTTQTFAHTLPVATIKLGPEPNFQKGQSCPEPNFTAHTYIYIYLSIYIYTHIKI